MAAEVITREDHTGGRAFEVVAGNLLEEPVDAIVNAANGHLAHGGGVAAAIARAAGPALTEEGDRIVAIDTSGPLQLEAYNANYVGGDIATGCSASTPAGGARGRNTRPVPRRKRLKNSNSTSRVVVLAP